MSEKVDYWINISDYDLETAKAMLSSKRYLYVGFLCHQVIEKALKAAIARDCKKGEIPPKIHDLSKLAEKANLYSLMSDDQQDFIDELNPLNIEARYPEYKNEIFSGLSKDICTNYIKSTEELQLWIKKQL